MQLNTKFQSLKRHSMHVRPVNVAVLISQFLPTHSHSLTMSYRTTIFLVLQISLGTLLPMEMAIRLKCGTSLSSRMFARVYTVEDME